MILFKNVELTFERGTILTQEMLGELQAFPKDILDILYDRYPDGILAGTDLIEEMDGSGRKEIFIRKGLVKYKGSIYRMPEDINLTQYIAMWTDQGKVEEQVTYKLVFGPGDRVMLGGRSTQVLDPLQLMVCPKSEEVEGIFYAQFKIFEKGNVTLFHEVDMENISRATYWNMTECPYACRGGVTYHPYIFQAIKKKLISKKRRSQLDYTLLNEISSVGTVSFEFIEMVLGDEQVKVCHKDRASVLKEFVDVVMREEEMEMDGGITKTEEEEDGRMLP